MWELNVQIVEYERERERERGKKQHNTSRIQIITFFSFAAEKHPATMNRTKETFTSILNLTRMKKRLMKENSNWKAKEPTFDGECSFGNCSCTMFENEDKTKGRLLLKRSTSGINSNVERKKIHEQAKKFVLCKNCGHGNVWHIKTKAERHPRYRKLLQREYSKQFALKNMEISPREGIEEEGEHLALPSTEGETKTRSDPTGDVRITIGAVRSSNARNARKAPAAGVAPNDVMIEEEF